MFVHRVQFNKSLSTHESECRMKKGSIFNRNIEKDQLTIERLNAFNGFKVKLRVKQMYKCVALRSKGLISQYTKVGTPSFPERKFFRRDQVRPVRANFDRK